MPPARAAEWIRNATPADVAGLLPTSIAVSSVLVLAVVEMQRLLQSPSAYGPTLTSWSLVALVVSLVVARGARAGSPFPELPAGMSVRGFKSYVIAIATGILLLVIPAFLLVWRAKVDDIPDWTAPFLNKRWLVALFWLATATFLVLPSVVRRMLGWDPAPDGAGADASIDVSGADRVRRPWVVAAGIAFSLAVAWYCAGPPWYVGTRHGPVDFHEQVHLGPLQAISKGYVPYVGPASTMYGPGSQLLIYGVMKSSGQFNIVTFRDGFAALHFIAFAIVTVLSFWLLGFWEMLLVVALGLTYSPLGFFRFDSDGSLAGFYGWANAVRYVGALVVVPLVAQLVFDRRARAFPHWPAVGLGVVWGLSAWMSQENLSTTLAATAVLLTLLWSSGTCSLTTVRAIGGGLALGFAAAWLPVLVYYTAHGALFAFVRNYFLVPSAVAAGYLNTWWAHGPDHPQFNAFRFTIVVVVLVGVCTVTDVRTFRLRRGLTPRQALLLAFVCVLTACYQTALYRSDFSHLVNTMIALPFVLVLGIRDLPAWVSATLPGRGAFRALFIALALYVYPLSSAVTDAYGALVLPSLNRLRTPASLGNGQMAAAVARADDREPFRRATPFLADEPAVALGSVPMRTFLEFAADLKTLVGDRRTYIELVPSVYTSLVYFMADLTPGPYLFDKESMILNDPIFKESVAYFEKHAPEFDCVIAESMTALEGQIFLKSHPGARVVERHLGTHPVYVLLAGATADQQARDRRK